MTVPVLPNPRLGRGWRWVLLALLTLSPPVPAAIAQVVPPDMDPCRVTSRDTSPAISGPILAGTWKTFGVDPNAEGMLGTPVGVAIDTHGTAYVLDAEHARVLELAPDGTWLGQWGSRGAAPGEFEDPAAITFDAAGNLFVADSGNNRVQKLSPDGQPLAQWGSAGIAPGQFLAPVGIAVDSEGFVYVADSGNTRVQKLAADGAPVVGWAAKTFRSDGPVALAVDGADNVYVAEVFPMGDRTGPPTPTAPPDLSVPSQGPGITKLSSDGRVLAHFGTTDPLSQGGDFLFPSSVALAPDGSVYVTTMLINPGLRKLSPGGRTVAQWPLPEDPTGRPSISFVASDTQGAVYVADSAHGVVRKHAPDGAVQAVWGTPRGTLGLLSRPSSVAVSAADEFVYVVDGETSDRLTQFSLEGQPLRQWGVRELGLPERSSIDEVVVDPRGHVFVMSRGYEAQVVEVLADGTRVSSWKVPDDGPGQVYFDRGLAVDALGAVFVAGSHTHRVFKLWSAGQVLAAFGGKGSAAGAFNTPVGVAVDSAGTIFVSDSANGRVQKLSATGAPLAQWGSPGKEPGQFLCPSTLAVDGEGRIYVVDGYNQRIQVLAPDGALLGVIASLPDGPELTLPAGLALDGHGGLFIADAVQNRITHVRLRPDASSASAPPEDPPQLPDDSFAPE